MRIDKDRRRGIDAEAAAQDAKATEGPLLLRAQQTIAPRDRRAQGLLPFWKIARRDRREQDVAIETSDQLLGGQGLHPRRDELQRERQRIELLTDRGHRGAVVVGELEVG